jgi:exodeoxyribonuclease V alpha subunit
MAPASRQPPLVDATPLGLAAAPPVLVRLLSARVISSLDVHVALTLGRLAGEESHAVMLAAALASRAVERGHVCVDLARIPALGLSDDDGAPVLHEALPAVASWLAALRASSLVSDGSALTPLVLDNGGRLYLRRYADYQRALAGRLRELAAAEVAVNDSLLAASLERFFPRALGSEAPDAQRLAAVLALTRRLAVISGGPGTGKTTTVVKILALLQEQALASGAALRIELVAPTGKAAARLAESVCERVEGLPCSEAVRAAVPRSAATIQRQLGFQPNVPSRFRHDASRPLAADAVIVDEASMVDLATMAKLVLAMRPDARLVLLGDRDHLASVEAGAILGDIFGPRREPRYSRAFAARAQPLLGAPLAHGCSVEPTHPAVGEAPSGLGDSLVELTESYRYRSHSGIGALARAVNAGDADAALAVLAGETAMPYGEVALRPLDEARPLAELGVTLTEALAGYFRASAPDERLAELNRFRILCPHRRGALGVEAINALVERYLRDRGLIVLDGPYYDGRPLLVTQNDYALGLFNGDLGVVVAQAGSRRVHFTARDASATLEPGPRALPPERLPPHETVFAMTVHKSQGSEFDRVALLLPQHPSPILTRELVYTAVSRARERVDIYGSAEVLRAAIGRRTERASGLSEALWGS